mmetsp:Transcript_5492/g.7601  ORF Transcript_5492/g.7601 Transcript_5492/m.7601 type:complete len:385 (-) Transcript_5492:237-1391(-)
MVTLSCVTLLISWWLVLICSRATVKKIGATIDPSCHRYQLKMTSTDIVPGAIIGGGRIGSYLYESNGGKDLLLSSRSQTLPPNGAGPIYICTRNNDLAAIIESTPLERREDLVFLQNGILTEFLETKGLSENTQALIYFAVSKKGEKPIDGKTDLNPEGLTAATGKWANDLSLRLRSGGLSCHVYDKEKFEIAMLEKHIWICAFMAVGSKYKCTVGEVEANHNQEVRAVIAELTHSAATRCKLSFPPGVEDRLCAYARSVSHFPTALKEFEWRNGWFMEHTLERMKVLQPDPSPLHTELIMSAEGNLFFQAKKAFAAKMDAISERARKNYEISQEIKAYEQYQRAKQGIKTTPVVLDPNSLYSPTAARFTQRQLQQQQQQSQQQ